MDVDPGNTLQVFNKVDRLAAPESFAGLKDTFPDALFISAVTGDGLGALKDALRRRRRAGFRETILKVPAGLESITGRIYEHCEVRDVRYDGGAGALYRLRAAPVDIERLRALGASSTRSSWTPGTKGTNPPATGWKDAPPGDPPPCLRARVGIR